MSFRTSNSDLPSASVFSPQPVTNIPVATLTTHNAKNPLNFEPEDLPDPCTVSWKELKLKLALRPFLGQRSSLGVSTKYLSGRYGPSSPPWAPPGSPGRSREGWWSRSRVDHANRSGSSSDLSLLPWRQEMVRHSTFASRTLPHPPFTAQLGPDLELRQPHWVSEYAADQRHLPDRKRLSQRATLI